MKIFIWSSKRWKLVNSTTTYFCHDDSSSSFITSSKRNRNLEDWRLWKLIFQPVHLAICFLFPGKIWHLYEMLFMQNENCFCSVAGPKRKKESFRKIHPFTRLRKVLITVTSTIINFCNFQQRSRLNLTIALGTWWARRMRFQMNVRGGRGRWKNVSVNAFKSQTREENEILEIRRRIWIFFHVEEVKSEQKSFKRYPKACSLGAFFIFFADNCKEREIFSDSPA